jgi:hypothetical protein
LVDDPHALRAMTNDARCAGKLAQTKGPTFEAEGKLCRACGIFRHN